MSKITAISAVEIKDSRGKPTLQVMVEAGSVAGQFSVPSGASTGTFEAFELRDKDGMGVKEAIENVNGIIAKKLVGAEVTKQKEIDDTLCELDGTSQKTKLGGNAIIGVSIAAAKAAAKSEGIEVFKYARALAPDLVGSQKIPYLYLNLINGGKHAQTPVVFQEYHIVPMVESVEDALEIGIRFQEELHSEAEKVSRSGFTVGDEGGLALNVDSVRIPLELLSSLIEKLRVPVRLALDVAASSFFKDGYYTVDGKQLNAEDLMRLYQQLIKDFNILSIEDPFNENDFDNFAQLIKKHPETMIVGDDLTVTNPLRIQEAVNNQSITGVIIKPNQIGTLTETIEAIGEARAKGVRCIVSHRSGETMDDFIADLSVAFGCYGLKAGAPLPAERMVKYERL